MKATSFPEGVPVWLSKTVEEFLGVPINYYAQVDFEAFVKFIDDIGGLPVMITETMTLDPIGNYNEQTFEPGSYTLPGQMGTCHMSGLVRVAGMILVGQQRQQQAIIAMRNQILNGIKCPN